MSHWWGHEQLHSIMTTFDLHAKYGTYHPSITLVSRELDIKRV